MRTEVVERGRRVEVDILPMHRLCRLAALNAGRSMTISIVNVEASNFFEELELFPQDIWVYSCGKRRCGITMEPERDRLSVSCS